MLRRNTRPAHDTRRGRRRWSSGLIRLVAAPLAVAALAACSTAVHAAGAPATASSSPTMPAPLPSSSAPTPATSSGSPARVSAPRTTPKTSPRTSAAAAHGQALPLGSTTGSATEVITVVASSTSSTTAVLQAWTKAPGGGWRPHGGAITAHVGSAGLTTHPSESLSATPIGSFTLTRAFGHDPNPGTTIPYHQTSPADWWISQYGGAYTTIYNTMQTCSAACPFSTAASGPNEHLYYETPFYNYAMVINYNTDPVVQGAGSAFFLHVTNGAPTAGCVSIPQADLVSIMRWLTPGDHPRILIGLG